MSFTRLDDEELEIALRQLGRDLGGATRDVSADVVAALRPGGRAGAARGQVRRPIIVLVIVTLLALGAATVIRVGVGGVDIRESSLPRRARTPLGVDSAFLGSRTTLDDARRRVDFDVGVPAANWLGEPDVYVAAHPPGGRVSLVYPASRDLPAIGATHVGLLLTAFRGTVETDFLTKLRASGAPVTGVRIGPTHGWWIEQTHDVLYLDPAHEPASERLRFSDSTLLWSRDGVTMRLESGLDLQRAVDVAASVRRERP